MNNNCLAEPFSYCEWIHQAVNNAFYNKWHIFLPILEKDSVPRFLRFLKEYGQGVFWRGMITPETFNYMMIDGSLKCAKPALEGQAPELDGHRANPNCMNQYGHFPLHEAAESFNVDMIKLLLDHGALPSVRTAGTEVVEGLLPLHIAVENTCLHKYLEENLFVWIIRTTPLRWMTTLSHNVFRTVETRMNRIEEQETTVRETWNEAGYTADLSSFGNRNGLPAI
jgi:hypothetical protein